MKWKQLTGVLCDKNVPIKLKDKVYKTVIKPTMTYGAESWAVRKRREQIACSRNEDANVRPERTMSETRLYKRMPKLGSSDRKMNLETEIPVMTHCKEPALTSKMTLTFFESVNGLILY